MQGSPIIFLFDPRELHITFTPKKYIKRNRQSKKGVWKKMIVFRES